MITSAPILFTVTANDGHGGASSQDLGVMVKCVNDAPVLSAIANQVLTEDTPQTVALSATDADGDTVTVTVSGSAGTVSGSISGSTLTLTPAADYAMTTPINPVRVAG